VKLRFGKKQLWLGISLIVLIVCVVAGYKILSSSPRPNIIIIIVDTLRADHVGCYGYSRETTPNIDRFSGDAAIFTDCFTPCPRTTQAMASIMTGRYPWNHGVRHLWDRLPARETTLAEILSKVGYETVGVIGTDVLLNKLDDGFDLMINEQECLDARTLTDHAIAELKKLGAPYFLWIHYYDVHMSYSPPEVIFDREYEGRFKRQLGAETIPGTRGELIFKNSMSPQDREHAIALYDSEIYFVDREVGRLIKFIEEKARDNIIIVTADHGEGLGEHDYYYDHGVLLNRPSIHVPLLIKGLGSASGRLSRAVGLVDIAPTLLQYLGLAEGKDNYDGKDLLSTDISPIFSEGGTALLEDAYETEKRRLKGIWGRPRSVVFGNKKLIFNPDPDGGSYQLFDIDSDPEESVNLIDSPGIDIRELKEKLSLIARRDQEKTQEAVIGADERKRLQALGYLN